MDRNPYERPEDFGLEHLGTIEWSEVSYRFDMTAVWKDTEDPKVFYWADDAGCSCPAPFKDLKDKDDLKSGSWMKLHEHLIGRANEKPSEEPDENGVRAFIWDQSREQATMKVIEMMKRVV